MTETPRKPSTRFLLRPCLAEDLSVMENFAEASAHGLTTLPCDRAALADRIERSLQSFSTEDVSGEEIYLFVVEDCATGEVVGTSGIAARAGFSDRFYSYRNEFVVHRSQAGLASDVGGLHRLDHRRVADVATALTRLHGPQHVPEGAGRHHGVEVAVFEEGERTIADEHDLASRVVHLGVDRLVHQGARHVAGEGVARLVVVVVRVDEAISELGHESPVSIEPTVPSDASARSAAGRCRMVR